MVSIWLGAALLILLALVFVFWPLLVRESEQKASRERQTLNVDLYDQRRAELDEQLKAGDLDEAQHEALCREMDLELVEAEKQPSESGSASASSSGRVVFLLSAAVLAVFVFGFYQYNGASEDIRITEEIRDKFMADTQAIQAGKDPDPALARRLMSQLEERLEKDPENTQYLYLLARNAADLQEYPTAINAYRAILAIDESPLVMGELAQLLFVVGGNRITPDAEALIDKTLSLDPNSHVALGLDGIRYFQTERYQKAIEQWEKAIKLLGPQSAGSQSLAAGVLRARALLAEQNGGPVSSGAVAQVSPHQVSSGQEAQEQPSSLSLKLKIDVADGIQLNPEHAVFVYARAWQGAPMPLAISRLKVKDLPAEIELSEAMAMAPGMSIAQFPQLELVARVSASGQAIPQPGDWQVTLGPVANSSQDQHLLQIQKQL
ncbi:c-type cytochrome biogenesis protein CcmI [Pseudoteredinibacter isoporae]|uniref:Cytochrome c-type biogenesis protein CcmH n=1 Tax=Pseudoteredinibacter isoporae TaxID=570281 RepID=A0A7X0MVV4_9GAMM|nr:c-type cytochrome biogenesis protein CcmI [Pseudoteredinibacter isoporae]MBB6521793.1 cytochrome c-type biogenesis protein CcmH [Pseudoteredinibacter isoporae]NHO87339.1 c-type cytochrome biogenesis protein CcmI [Pseudoteredinibacter isoporae]NIB23029.1 c-type cytochrome biogenesis protein CcmI [Pseudoteredinibacter isoporae]